MSDHYSPDLVDMLDLCRLRVLAHEHPTHPEKKIGIWIEVRVAGWDEEAPSEYLRDDEAAELRDWLNEHFPEEATNDHA